MRFEPPIVYARHGEKFYIELHDKDGVCDIEASKMIVFTTSDRVSAEITDVESKTMNGYIS